MDSIVIYFANSTGKLSKLQLLIEKAFERARKDAIELLDLNMVDVIVVYAPALVIPEHGTSGNSPGPHNIYLSVDPDSDKITENNLYATFMHEFHHCKRWRGPDYDYSFKESLVFEGLATLFEAEVGEELPIYSNQNIKDSEIAKAKELLNADKYDHAEWFFGRGDITRWFGYTYGYRLCKKYADAKKKTAAELVDVKSEKILEFSL